MTRSRSDRFSALILVPRFPLRGSSLSRPMGGEGGWWRGRGPRVSASECAREGVEGTQPLTTRRRVCCRESLVLAGVSYPDVCRGGDRQAATSQLYPPHHLRRAQRAWNLRYLSQSSVHPLLLRPVTLCKLKTRPSCSDPRASENTDGTPQPCPVTICDRDSLNPRSTLVPVASETQ